MPGSWLSRSRSSAARVVCMAHPRRVARVAKQIEREVGQLLLQDRVLLEAVNPERRRGLDSAVSALASVTEVVVSNDLQVAKVYVSLFSDEAGKGAAMAGLKGLEGYVRKHIGRQIRLRLTPEIRFLQDDSLERADRVFKLLERAEAQRRGEVEPPPVTIEGSEWRAADDEAKYADWIEGLEGVELQAGEEAPGKGLATGGDGDSDEDVFFVNEDVFFDDGSAGGAGGRPVQGALVVPPPPVGSGSGKGGGRGGRAPRRRQR